MFDANKVCMNCMNPLDEVNSCCHFCGANNSMEKNKAHQLECGSILAGAYFVGRVLGQGGFGITYIGYDLNLNIKVAIKEYYPEGFVTRDIGTKTLVITLAEEKVELFENGKTRFLKEAQMLASFAGDKGIVNVRNFFSENGTAYIVMDYIEGETLKKYAEHQGGKISSKEVLEKFKPFFASIIRIHEVNLLHRDISPDNIILQPDGTLTLIDFGAARQMSIMGEHSNTINVKHGFAPEEQYRTRGEQGPWTDVYAICATIYKLSTGITPPNVLDRVMTEARLIPPNQIGATFTQQQENALLHGLQIRAIERTKDAHQLFEELYTEIGEIPSHCTSKLPEDRSTAKDKVFLTSKKTIKRVFNKHVLISSSFIIAVGIIFLTSIVVLSKIKARQSDQNAQVINNTPYLDEMEAAENTVTKIPVTTNILDGSDTTNQETTQADVQDAESISTPATTNMREPVSLSDRTLTDNEIIALSEKSATAMRKATSLPADAIALLNACVDNGVFREIIDGSQASAPGSNVFMCSSGESCLSGAAYVDPKDFSLMLAYLLSDDYETGVIVGFSFNNPNSAICYIYSGGQYQLINVAEKVHHGRPMVVKQFNDATVATLDEYVDQINNKKVFRTIYAIPNGNEFSYTDYGQYVEINDSAVIMLWSVEA